MYLLRYIFGIYSHPDRVCIWRSLLDSFNQYYRVKESTFSRKLSIFTPRFILSATSPIYNNHSIFNMTDPKWAHIVNVPACKHMIRGHKGWLTQLKSRVRDSIKDLDEGGRNIRRQFLVVSSIGRGPLVVKSFGSLVL